MSPARVAWAVMTRAEGAWAEVASRDPAAREVLLRFAAPMALLPAAGWAMRLQPLGPAARLESFAMTYGLVIVAMLCVAAGIWLVAPMYGVARRWPRAVAVAAYGSTPLLASGLLFVSPLLAAVGVVAMLHCLYLYSAGLRIVVGCRAGDAAEYTAIAFLLSLVLSGAIGAAGGASGLL